MTSRTRSLFWTRGHQGEALAQGGHPRAMYTGIFMRCLVGKDISLTWTKNALWTQANLYPA